MEASKKGKVEKGVSYPRRSHLYKSEVAID
jgi:hypothetical protein